MAGYNRYSQNLAIRIRVNLPKNILVREVRCNETRHVLLRDQKRVNIRQKYPILPTCSKCYSAQALQAGSLLKFDQSMLARRPLITSTAYDWSAFNTQYLHQSERSGERYPYVSSILVPDDPYGQVLTVPDQETLPLGRQATLHRAHTERDCTLI